MNQIFKKSQSTDQYPLILMTVVYIIQSIFFIYIDEGNFSLHQYQDFGTWVFTFGVALVFLFFGWLIYVLLNKKTRLDQFPKLVLSFLLTLPFFMLFLIIMGILVWSFYGIVSLLR